MIKENKNFLKNNQNNENVNFYFVNFHNLLLTNINVNIFIFRSDYNKYIL